MQIQGVNSIKERNIVFEGKRTDRNAVKQLAKNNRYSLTEPNQRYITMAIENLGQVKGSKNIKFLLNTAAKNAYSTNIVLQDLPKHNWRAKLLAAAAAAIAITPFVSKQIKEKIAKLSQPQDLNETELQILELRKQLLELVDLEQVKKESKSTMKNFEKNLDYFIVSSETTLEHKKYVLERLNYFMSDEYDINPQLEGKKSLVVAEMINDMAIEVPNSKVPNIKAVNQKQHGMCAAISIVRKKLAYEDKPNYVDAILSELDSSDRMLVYDRTKLGSGKKVEVRKISVDFTTALEKGYRIIDASTMHWMHIATMTGSTNASYQSYNPFDKENFDVKADAFFNNGFEKVELQKTHEYYQALMKAKEIIGEYKAKQIKSNEKITNKRASQREDVETLNSIISTLREKFVTLAPDSKVDLVNGILHLEYSVSDKLPAGNKYAYIPNEEASVKKEKIYNFIVDNSSVKNVDKETLESLFGLVELYHQTAATEKAGGANKKINRARSLYEVGAAYRYQLVKGLEDRTTLENAMINEKIADKETLLLNVVQLLKYQLEQDTKYTEDIVKTIAPLIADEVENPTRKDALAFLGGLEEVIVDLLDNSIETLYYAMGFENGSRTALINMLVALKDLAENGNKKDIEDLAERLQVKKNKFAIVDKLNEQIAAVDSGDVDAITKVYDILGKKSQVLFLADTYQALLKEISGVKEGEENIALNNFLKNNKLKPEDTEAFQQRLEDIRNEINAAASFFALYTDLLKVYSESGELIVSADPKDVIIDKWEKHNQIPTEKALKELQEHLSKIDKERSADEFQSRRGGKLKDKSLYKFSKLEEKTLDDIEDSANQMYSLISKELKRVLPTIREDLEELNIGIGIETGSYWNMEGSSGLYSAQEIRVLEYMTGRPHYATEDLKEAIEQIKTSPYSGISASSVFHDKSGFHAQYIVDIEPVEVEVKDENGNLRKEKREILYQDNTWGATENENVWVDSNGQIRTDYSDNRGGNLGYITNDKLRNGNYVDRILGDMVLSITPDKTENRVYKRLMHTKNADPWSMPQYRDILLEGKSPHLRDVAAQIHDTLLLPSSKLLSSLEEQLKTKKIDKKDLKESLKANLYTAEESQANVDNNALKEKTKTDTYTTEELQAKIDKIKLTASAWKITYDTLYQRIFPPFGDVKISKEDYAKLADNDQLKVVMERIAFRKRYPLYGNTFTLAKVNDLKGLKRFETAQRLQAVEDFKYAFAKNFEIMNNLAEQFGLEEELALKKILKKYGVELSDEAIDEITEQFGLEEDDFNGSLEKTIRLIVEDLSPIIDKHVKNTIANQEVKNFFNVFLKEHSYFSQADFKNEKIKHIIKFIDRVYDPIDDKEFVKIYRKIQNMTNEEFEKEILSKVTKEDLGYKNVTGYDILKEIQRHNENYEYDLMNEVYYEHLSYDLKMLEKHDYKYRKFHKDLRYPLNYDFDSLYRHLKNDLFVLNYPKMFNEYKQRNFERYGAFPAYPKVEVVNKKVLDTSIEFLKDSLTQCISEVNILQNQVESYGLVHELNVYVANFSPDMVIGEEQYKTINNYLGEFVTRNYEDESISKALNAAMNLLEIPQGSTWASYIKDYSIFKKKLEDVEKTASIEQLELMQAKMKAGIDEAIRATAITVLKKYRGQFIQKANELKQAYIKNNSEKIEKLEKEIYEDYKKYQLLNDPDELFDTYVLSFANDYKGSPDDIAIYRTYLTRCLNYALVADVQNIIMEAIGQGVATKAKQAFSEYPMGIVGDEFVDMGSDMAIATMVDSLVVEGDRDTALLFLDKFGLNESYINYVIKNFDLEKLEKAINNIGTLTKNYIEFKQEVSPEIDAAKVLLDEGEDSTAVLNKLLALVHAAGEKYSIPKEYMKNILPVIKECAITFADAENIDKSFLFHSKISTALSKTENYFDKKIDKFNEELANVKDIFTILNEITLPEESLTHIKRIEFSNKFAAMMNRLVSEGGLQVLDKSDTI